MDISVLGIDIRVYTKHLSRPLTTGEPAVVYRHPELNEDGEVRERRFHLIWP